MKKGIFCLAFFIIVSHLFAVDVSGDTSVFVTGSNENSSFIIGKTENNIDFIAIQNLSLGFTPTDDIFAQCDFTYNGSLKQYKSKGITVDNITDFDINQVYILLNLNKLSFFFGKKILNYGYSDFKPLVNLVNSRKDDFGKLVYKGAGVIGCNYYPFSWLNLSNVFYFQSSDLKSDISDISTVFISDFYFLNSTFSLYVYLQELSQLKFPPLALSFSNQIGFFSIYGEGIFQKNPEKYEYKDSSFTLLREDNYFDITCGIRFYDMKFQFILEYCYTKTGYDSKQVDSIIDLFSISTDKDTLYQIVYDGISAFYKNNCFISLGYTFPNNFTINIMNSFSFPAYGCSKEYYGDCLKFVATYLYKQSMEFQLSAFVNFGGEKSEFIKFNKGNIGLNLGMVLKY